MEIDEKLKFWAKYTQPAPAREIPQGQSRFLESVNCYNTVKILVCNSIVTRFVWHHREMIVPLQPDFKRLKD